MNLKNHLATYESALRDLSNEEIVERQKAEWLGDEKRGAGCVPISHPADREEVIQFLVACERKRHAHLEITDQDRQLVAALAA